LGFSNGFLGCDFDVFGLSFGAFSGRFDDTRPSLDGQEETREG